MDPTCWFTRSSAVCRQVPGPLSCCAVAFAADRRLPALDADLPERRDHVVCCSLGDLDEREAIGDLDRADLPAGQVRLAGDDADEILRPDSRRTASPHKQPRRGPGRRASAPLVAARGLATPAAVVRRRQIDLWQFLFVARRSARIGCQLDRRQCHLIDAELFAERLHQRVRRELWGYAPDEALTNTDLIAERYQGIRPAPGYPACPDHTEKQTLFDLLEAESRAGIKLTESFAMWPGAAVSGYYLWNPASHYFGVGRIGRDQLADYAARKGVPLSEAERWLAQNLVDET